MFRGFTRTEHNLTLGLAIVILAGFSLLQARGNRTYSPSIRGNVIQHAPGELVQQNATNSVSSPAAGPTGRIDLNTADAALLETLPGIGASKAEAIIRYRDQHGPFRSVQDLNNVSGIGDKTIQVLEPLVKTEGAVAIAAAPLAPVDLPAIPTAVAAAATPVPIAAAPASEPIININTATAAQLEELAGVGPALAQRIIADRAKNGPFRSVQELERVKGIGPKIVEQNLHRLSVK